jgi:hypothetical protein
VRVCDRVMDASEWRTAAIAAYGNVIVSFRNRCLQHRVQRGHDDVATRLVHRNLQACKQRLVSEHGRSHSVAVLTIGRSGPERVSGADRPVTADRWWARMRQHLRRGAPARALAALAFGLGSPPRIRLVITNRLIISGSVILQTGPAQST